MIHEEQRTIDALCSKWRDACDRVDRYYEAGEMALLFSVEDQLSGFLSGVRDCALILDYQNLHELADTAAKLWCYRPTVDSHRIEKV